MLCQDSTDDQQLVCNDKLCFQMAIMSAIHVVRNRQDLFLIYCCLYMVGAQTKLMCNDNVTQHSINAFKSNTHEILVDFSWHNNILSMNPTYRSQIVVLACKSF